MNKVVQARDCRGRQVCKAHGAQIVARLQRLHGSPCHERLACTRMEKFEAAARSKNRVEQRRGRQLSEKRYEVGAKSGNEVAREMARGMNPWGML